MRLTGKQKRALREALLAAFPTQPAFRMMVRDVLDRNLDEIALGNDLTEIVFKTIEQAEAKGWLSALIDGAAESAGGPPMTALAKELLAVREDNAGQPPRDVAAPRHMYEAIIRERSPLVHVEVLLDFLERAMRRVCVVEDRDGDALGTGFLVGPDVLMTCHHVIRAFIGSDGTYLRARFDYRTGHDGKTAMPGTPYTLAAEWLLALAQPSPLDLTGQDAEPDPTHLDFALLRLGTAVGHQKVDGEARGWIQLPPSPAELRLDDIVCILQHPRGRPLQVALDSVLRQTPWGTRVRYAANTESGSSGSPCFNLHRKLVAMHHCGAVAADGASYNQGIPATALRALLEERKLTHLLGGDAE